MEAKEGLEIQNETVTLASISYQNFFRSFPKLAGMTGTAATEETEFKTIYRLEVRRRRLELETLNPKPSGVRRLCWCDHSLVLILRDLKLRSLRLPNNRSRSCLRTERSSARTTPTWLCERRMASGR